MTTTNSVVANAIKAQTVRNSVEVEISPGYAARVQHAMRDAARVVSGVRMTSTNTLECRDEDAADDVIDILKQAGLPDVEVRLRDGRIEKPSKMLITSNASRSTNAVVAKALNARAVCNETIEGVFKGLDSGKYDSVAVAPRDNGFPEVRRYGGGVGFSYGDEDELRAMIKSGKYVELLFYKNHSLKGRIPLNASRVARNAEASQKLRNAWHSAFDALKGLYAAAQAERHSAIADAANKAVKTLMDNTKDLGIS